jgi:hypothetical protein
VITRCRLVAVVLVLCAWTGIVATNAGAAALPAWAPIAGTGPTVIPLQQSEVQEIVVEAEGGTFTTTFNGQTTASLPFNATTAEVGAALNGLSSIGGVGGSVRVQGGPGSPGGGTPYIVEFGGGFENLNQPVLTANSAALIGTPHLTEVRTRVEGGPGQSTLGIFFQNIGGAASSGPITLTGSLPSGVLLNGAAKGVEGGWSCSNSGDSKSFTCTYPNSVLAGVALATPTHPLIAEPGALGALGDVHVNVEGGGAVKPASFEFPLTISETPALPGFQAFTAGAYDEEGKQDARAGGHPYIATSGILANVIRNPQGELIPAGDFRNIKVALPPGFLGNPTATPTCPAKTSDTVGVFGKTNCPMSSIVGFAQPATNFGGFNLLTSNEPVVNVEAPFGFPAEFKFNVSEEVIHVTSKLRSDDDYGLDVESANTPTLLKIFGTFFTFWGNPASSTHNAQRCKSQFECGFPGAATETAFLTSPTNCSEEAHSPPVTTLTTNTWQHPEIVGSSSIQLPPVTGCENLHFESEFTFNPTEGSGGSLPADSPSGFGTELTVPSEGLTDLTKLTTPEAKTTVIKFPTGVTLNPSAAGGLEACSEAQIGFKGSNFAMPNPIRFTNEPNTCPESSKIGTLEIKTPLLEEPLHGDLYLARQTENPFGGLFAVYLVIEDARHGITIKLPGQTEPDPQTGQIIATFDDLPQLPFESLKLAFKGGSRSIFATPETCGKYVTTTVNTPWSAPESGAAFETNEKGQGFTVDSAPGGGACAATPGARPFNLGMSAGSAGTQAGAHSPFSIRITRPDGAQEISSLDIVTPTGLTATLAGVPYCPDAAIAAAAGRTGKEEQANPSCPAASQVGTTEVGAGAGSAPFYTPGRLYLAGPYKGAPLSIVAITPALAGPFDLGNVVVRTALFVNPETTQITAKSDPLPEFLKGVQLRIRDVRINLDRSDFTLNPTSCDPKSVGVTVHGNSGAVANLSSRFQVGNCSALPFEPDLKLKVIGKTGRNAKPALRAELTAKPGEANIATAQVNLPHSEFLEQNHIKTVCTRVQFAEGDGNGSACPAGSVYGHATAWSPLLEKPLEGNVYLRSNGGERKLPDLVAALDGQVDIALWGKVDSGPNHGIRNTFEVVPDAPVSRFVLQMNGGRKGLLVNSENLCSPKAQRKAIVRLTGQNGKVHAFKPVVQNQCKKKKAKKNKKGHKKSGRK